MERAVAAGAALLARARTPVVAGLVADVDGIRAAYCLAAAIGASVDPLASGSLYADLSVFARAATMPTTPREAVSRADLVLVVGGSAAARAPLVAELRASRPTTGRAAGEPRAVLALGDGGDVGTGAGGVAAALGLLRALAAGRLRRDGHPLADLAGRLRDARFGVALYDPGELGDLAIEMLQGLVVDLNETTRFFALALPDPWQGRACLQVAAWTTSQAPRSGFGRGVPEHDPWRFDAARQAAAGEADALVWLASLPAPRPAWADMAPALALLGDADGSEGEVVIAVGVPGETADGTLWDEGRNALAFRPAARPDDGRPTAAAVLDAIERGIAAC